MEKKCETCIHARKVPHRTPGYPKPNGKDVVTYKVKWPFFWNVERVVTHIPYVEPTITREAQDWADRSVLCTLNPDHKVFPKVHFCGQHEEKELECLNG